MSLPLGLLSFSTVSLPTSAHYLWFSASLQVSAKHSLKDLQDWRLPWGGVRNVGRWKQNLLVSWRPGKKHEESERNDGGGFLQDVGRQRGRVRPTASLLVGLLKSPSPLHLQRFMSNLNKWACLFCVEATPERNDSFDVSMNTLMQLQRLWLQWRPYWVLTCRLLHNMV